MVPSLPDLLQVVGGGGLVIGAGIGLALSASSNRDLAENVALGGALGAIAGTLAAFAISLGAALAGA